MGWPPALPAVCSRSSCNTMRRHTVKHVPTIAAAGVSAVAAAAGSTCSGACVGATHPVACDLIAIKEVLVPTVAVAAGIHHLPPRKVLAAACTPQHRLCAAMLMPCWLACHSRAPGL